MRPDEKLDLWKKAVDFFVAVYKATDAFPSAKILITLGA
jgi:hypothetical protein